jgi:hypothetical protein
MLKNFSLITGWTGIISAAIAILTKNTFLYVASQFLAALSSISWMILINGKVTTDSLVSFGLSTIALLVKSEWLVYAASLSRAVSYQFILMRRKE